MRLPDSADLGALSASGYPDALAAAERQACEAYARELNALAAQAEARGDREATAALVLLLAACSLRLDLSPGGRPLRSAIPLGAHLPPDPDIFTPAHLDFFAGVVTPITSAELRARLADLLWLRRHGDRPHEHALVAVTDYVEAAESLAGSGQWLHVPVRAERAMDLAVHLGRPEGVYDDAVERVVALAERALTENPAAAVRIMDTLQSYHEGEATHFAARTEEAAKAAEGGAHWHLARLLWGRAAGWYELAGDDDAVVRAAAQGAEAHVRQAEHEAVTNGGLVGAPNRFEAAIKAYRRIGGHAERIAELHTRMLEVQREAVKVLSPSLLPPSVREARDQALAWTGELAEGAVAGQPLHHALITLALGVPLQSVDVLRTRAEAHLQDYLGMALLPLQLINAEGRTVARQPAPLTTDEMDREAAARAEIFSQSKRYREIAALGWIEPARLVILREHEPSLEDLYDLVAPSGWIPPGRESAYVRGLHTGLYGDFMAAVHLLIPQIEHAIRHLLYAHGHIASGLDDQGIQDEHNLNALLYRRELVELMGEDLVFDLQAVLAHRFGHNLRNRVAHGLLSDFEYNTPEALYLWWLALRLVVLPLVATGEGDTPNGTDGGAEQASSEQERDSREEGGGDGAET